MHKAIKLQYTRQIGSLARISSLLQVLLEVIPRHPRQPRRPSVPALVSDRHLYYDWSPSLLPVPVREDASSS